VLDFIAFSKDRPAQVDLLLRSIARFAAGRARVSVVFSAAGEAARRGYAEARAEHDWVTWVDEAEAGGFRAATLERLAAAGERVSFLVDDMVFTHALDLEAPALLALDRDPEVLCCSLRLDPAKAYCYALDRWTAPPERPDGTTWRWAGCAGDWGYPMSTDAHVFRTAQLRPLVESLGFHNPNALEAALAEHPLPPAKMACGPVALVTNVPDNRVQDTAPNRHAGGDAEAQTAAFLAGRRLALEPFAGFRAPAVHQERPLLWEDEERPRVSVVIPCHDMAATLADAVGSVRASDFDGPVEIVVVDDGSTDASADVARALGVRLVQRPASGHPGHARNAGFASAVGEYVLPLDADDRIDPGFLTATVAALDAHPHAGFAYGEQRDFGGATGYHATPPYDFSALPTKNFLGSATLVRHVAWSAVGGYDPTLGYEDWDLWIALGHAGWHGVKAPGAVFEHRVGDSGVWAADIRRDRETKARFVAKRPELYDAAQIAWAHGVLVGDPAAVATPDTVGIVPSFMAAPALDTRSFTIAAVADELVDRPALLEAFGYAFVDADDVTLVILGASPDDDLAARLGPVISAAGLDREDAPDLLGLPGGPAEAAAVAAQAHALLSARAAAPAFARLPRFDATDIWALRRLAGESGTTHVPHPETVVAVGPYELHVPPDMAWCFVGGDFYERNVATWMDRIVADLGEPVVFDIGANCGYYALRCAARGATVLAFEPVGATYAALRSNLERNGLDRRAAVRAAVGEGSGTATINLYNSSGNNSLWRRNVDDGVVGTEEVDIVSVDDLVAAGRPAPGLIKIDTEGAELSVLRGAARTIAEHHPWILLEYSADTARDAGYDVEQLAAELESHGYELAGLSADVDDDRPRPRSAFASGEIDNVIAIPPGATLPAA
jgi:FkbM family methyltransferase